MTRESTIDYIRQWRARRPMPHGLPNEAHHPRIWVAKLTERLAYYGKGCCEEWSGSIYIYRWEAAWENVDSDIPWPNPKLDILFGPEDPNWPVGTPSPENGYECKFERPGWPVDYTLGPAAVDSYDPDNPERFAQWAVNTAEFDYSQYLMIPSIDIGGGITRSLGRTAATYPKFVLMAWGLFDAFDKCAVEPRAKRWIPFFHGYVQPPWEFPCE